MVGTAIGCGGGPLLRLRPSVAAAMTVDDRRVASITQGAISAKKSKKRTSCHFHLRGKPASAHSLAGRKKGEWVNPPKIGIKVMVHYRRHLGSPPSQGQYD